MPSVVVVTKAWPQETSLGEAEVKDCLVEVGWVAVGLSVMGRKVQVINEQKGEFSAVQRDLIGLQKWALGIRVGKEAKITPLPEFMCPFLLHP